MILAVLFAVPRPSAEPVQTDLGEIAFRQALRDMGTDLRLMCVAAHPDDEDGATLAMYRMRHGLKTYAVIATRGEGGQNEIGPELYEELAVIRTREMLAASRITGAETRFLDLPEFGFSKSKEETFAIWGHDEALRRMVRVIREIRPDVIITNHGTMNDHGHHQAIGQIVLEAFDAAADPAQFPELGMESWQAARLYQREWQESAKSLRVDIGMVDKWRGKSYAEIAAEALTVHRSQGMGFFIERYLRGDAAVHYILAREAPQTKVTDTPAPAGVLLEGLFDRVSAEYRDLSKSEAPRVELKATLAKRLSAMAGFNPARTRRLARAYALAAGLQLQARIADEELVPGQTTTVELSLRDGSGADAMAQRLFLTAGEADRWSFGPPSSAAKAELSFTTPNDAAFTVPHGKHVFDAGFIASPITAAADVTTHDSVTVRLELPLPLDVAPPVTLEFVDAPYLARIGVDQEVSFRFAVENHAPGPVTGSLGLSPSQGLKLQAEPYLPFELAAEGDAKMMTVTPLFVDRLAPRDYYLAVHVDATQQIAMTKVRYVDLEVPANIRVGVVQSYDDTFVNTLEKMRVPHEALAMADFAPARLDTFTSIVIDIRAYLVRPDLVANNQALLEYVERGGTLLVMYQKTYEWKPEYAPYPIYVSHNRVTREDAPVELLAPDHPLFTGPNKVEASDWNGWIQERGLYFPAEWDAAYTPLIATSDPGEDIPPGSYLIAQYGEGHYVYTALGWYRQLRELHPGALRMFANMLALGTEHAPAAQPSEE